MAKWNPDTIAAEAKKYTTKSAFTKGSQRAAKKAKELGIYEIVCEHMCNKYKIKSYEDLKADALKYSTRGEFQLKSAGSYVTARTRGILDDICGHMKNKHEKWTYEKVEKVAKKYNRRIDFQKQSINAYATAKRKGWLDEVCEHMIEVFHSWANEELKQEALKYQHRSDFQHGSKAAYLFARRRNLLDEICEHMTYKDGATRLEEEMYMYYIKIDTLDSSLPTVWKIGITRYADVMRRFSREINRTKTKITVLKTWYYKEGYNAAIAEREIMKKYEEFSYKGDSPLRETKTTEMFIADILKLDEEQV